MDVLAQISRLLKDGREREARELFFEEECVELVQNMHTAVNSLIKDPKPMPELEVMWERLRKRLKP